MKTQLRTAPSGPSGERYLAMGCHIGGRHWLLAAGREDPMHARDYETCGYCIRGKATLYVEGKVPLILTAGVGWVVPKGINHRYHVDEELECVEGCVPIPWLHDRDKNVHRAGEAATAAGTGGSGGKVFGGQALSKE